MQRPAKRAAAFASIAQLAEHRTCNAEVEGSIPSGCLQKETQMKDIEWKARVPHRRFWEWNAWSDWPAVWSSIRKLLGRNKPPYYNWVDFAFITLSVEHSPYIHPSRFEAHIALFGLHMSLTTGYVMEDIDWGNAL
jgi:hypothetical protein